MPTPQAPQQQNQTQTQPRQPGAPQQGGGGGNGAQQPQTPGAPGGGSLTQPLFSGDHVLQTVAAGQVHLREGARGPSVRALQSFLVGQGLNVGRTGPDGSWGAATTLALKAWQSSHGVPATGVLGPLTIQAMEREPPVTAAPTTPGATPVAPATPRAQPTNPQNPAGTTQAQAAGGNRPAQGAPGSRNGGLPDNFQKMWDAHPHNYQQDGTDTSSADLQVAQGWNPDQYSNTCAIRLSIMLNQLGGNLKITREKAKGAGLDPGRIPKSAKTGWYYILSAKEMWIYLTKYAGQPHAQWPQGKRFKTSDEFQQNFDKDIEPVVSGKKGIVAFDKIFGFSGTGHVDVFDGTKLSDAPNWYPCESLKVWYI